MPDQRALVGMLASCLPAFDVRQQVDLRIARVAVLVEHMYLQLAELPAEGDLLGSSMRCEGKTSSRWRSNARWTASRCGAGSGADRSTPCTAAPITGPSGATSIRRARRP